MRTDIQALNVIYTTLILAFSSTAVSAVLGIGLALILEKYDFPLKKTAVRINRTMMGIPPVVAGLVVYLLLMRRGIFGKYQLLFTVKAMIIAQIIIITPIISGMVYTAFMGKAKKIRMYARSLSADKRQTDLLVLREMKNDIYFAVLTGFSRSISEVGAVMLVGGNIKGKTRTMTTAISLLKSQGIYTEGIFLGAVLLAISFFLQWLLEKFRQEEQEDENY